MTSIRLSNNEKIIIIFICNLYKKNVDIIVDSVATCLIWTLYRNCLLGFFGWRLNENYIRITCNIVKIMKLPVASYEN